MHQRSSRLPWVAAAQRGAVYALCVGLLTPALADPLVSYDGSHQADATIDTRKGVMLESEPLPVAAAPVSPTAIGTNSEPASTAERTLPPPPAGPVMPQRPGAAPIATQGSTQNTVQADADVSIHSAIKEGVRPVYEQLVESGVVDALHGLKADLGLNKQEWSEKEKPDPSVKGPGQWDAPSGQDPAQPPRTAAQAELDKEMARMMREKLIDQIAPWALGLVLLFGVGYLVKLLYRYVIFRSAKRSERQIARTRRHASRRSRSSSHSATKTPSAPHAATESQDTV